jgi:hypothetical protein
MKRDRPSVNLAAARLELMKLEEPTASQRYRVLVLDLGHALDFAHGWKAAVAKQLGVHPSYVGKVADLDMKVGVDVIERAMGMTGIPRSHFFAPKGHVESAGSDDASRVLCSIVPSLEGLDASSRLRVMTALNALFGGAA